MAKTPTPLTELFATLKGYINQLSSGERSASEVGSALNDWARDSAESIKAKIHEEVEASVSKMGFIKREEFDALLLRVKDDEVARREFLDILETMGTNDSRTVKYRKLLTQKLF
jgi:BMFP domain-containing protein YqiC